MFSKIGEKIKALAEVLCWLLIIASVISGLITFSTVKQGGIIIGIAVVIIGAICSWFASFMLYGFGELIDKTVQNEKNTAEIKNLLRQQIANETEQENSNKSEQESV